jgi:hypothetical protein
MAHELVGWLEVKVNGKWIAVKEMPFVYGHIPTLTVLANVYDDKNPELKPIVEARGLPDKLSDTVQFWADADKTCMIKPSWISLKEFLEYDWDADIRVGKQEIMRGNMKVVMQKYRKARYLMTKDFTEFISIMFGWREFEGRLVFWFTH